MSAPPDNVSVGGVRVSTPLVETVMSVRASQPVTLEVLATAMRNQAAAAAQALVSAPAEQFLQVQGRAQAFAAIADLLTNPDVYFNKLTRR